MSEFEQKLKEQMEKAVLKLISDGNWIAPAYYNRFKIPNDFLHTAWDLVDVDSVRKQLAKRIEEQMAVKIMNMMAKEISNDIKTVLSDQESREQIRNYAREYIKKLTNE